MAHAIALFGEAQREKRGKLIHIRSIEECCERLGHPTEDSDALGIAIQTLMFQYEVLFYQVDEEGFSDEDYFRGFKLLEDPVKEPHLHAICLPGVGNGRILGKALSLCTEHSMILMTSQHDLYDFLTHS